MLRIPGNYTLFREPDEDIVEKFGVDIPIVTGYGPSYGTSNEILARLLRGEKVPVAPQFQAWLEVEKHTGSVGPNVESYNWYEISVVGPDADAMRAHARRISLFAVRCARCGDSGAMSTGVTVLKDSSWGKRFPRLCDGCMAEGRNHLVEVVYNTGAVQYEEGTDIPGYGVLAPGRYWVSDKGLQKGSWD